MQAVYWRRMLGEEAWGRASETHADACYYIGFVI